MLRSASKRPCISTTKDTFGCTSNRALSLERKHIEAEIRNTLRLAADVQRIRSNQALYTKQGIYQKAAVACFHASYFSNESRAASLDFPESSRTPSLQALSSIRHRRDNRLLSHGNTVKGIRTMAYITNTQRNPSSLTTPKPAKAWDYKSAPIPAPPKPSASRKKATEDQVITNPVGVQLLSRPLHDQIFRNAKFPPPTKTEITLSQSHLKSHGLDTSQAQKLPNLSFTLPPLEGPTIDAHFWNIGSDLAGPSKDLANNFSTTELLPLPYDGVWQHLSGWTRYTRAEGESEWKVEPGKGPYEETHLVFDVETMPKEHQYAVMACAASPTAWYCWVSPWLLGETKDPAHLIPLGPGVLNAGGGLKERIVIGHNVAYDRARVLEEYDLKQKSGIRWIDTMALHVAVKGISSVQRPAWMAWNKEKKKKEETISQVLSDEDAEDGTPISSPFSEARLNEDLQRELDFESALESDEASDIAHERWESITSVNSLLEVAKLYCGIKMDKQIRNAFMVDTRTQIKDELTKYTAYCAMDVHTTHAVFCKVLPLFFQNCPHPASWAGVMQMGSSFLTVNQEWEKYLERAEGKFRELEGDVKGRLRELAEEAKSLMESGAWKGDIFLEQLDWSPKLAGKSKGFWVPTQKEQKEIERARSAPAVSVKPGRSSKKTKEAQGSVGQEEYPLRGKPKWYIDLATNPTSDHCRQVIIPLLLQVKWNKNPMFYSPEHGWICRFSNKVPEGDTVITPSASDPVGAFTTANSILLKPGVLRSDAVFWSRTLAGKLMSKGPLSTGDDELATMLLGPSFSKAARGRLMELADQVCNAVKGAGARTLYGRQLDWSIPEEASVDIKEGVGQVTEVLESASIVSTSPLYSNLPAGITPPDGLQYPAPIWPKWYWDLSKPRKDAPRGSIDITVKSRLTPMLLRLGWLGHPLFYSREHGWCYCVKPEPQEHGEEVAGSEVLSDSERRNLDKEAATTSSRSPPVKFTHPDDSRWHVDSVLKDYQFFKLPHAHGHEANVGNPLSKSFIAYAQDGTLKSLAKTGAAAGVEVAPSGSIVVPAVDETKNALDMNAMCSYWISARDRVLNQMVVWEKEKGSLGLGTSDAVAGANTEEKWGMILPQVITMGTVTRRAIEKTWLTASNAKKNRVGSELKAMVRAPPGYAIVGADVDSEELWISSVMGDAQFGMHGATAIGWMTLEGTKKAGTDLHSKTASILGISRDSAKVFNYSRIYGAGMRHAVLLLLQANPGMPTSQAQKLAENLYASTKGKNTHTLEYFGRKFWYGGTESFLFNKLESIALSDTPMTPALACGVTCALSKKHLPEGFGTDYLPSRINWVVQSSGVDYLHLLITSMEHLAEKYQIQARYMISVHDEVRYLVKEEDTYRAALALQIANLWTRSLFAYRLGLDDLPASVGFFSAVDIDWVLRKEVDMECVTPSQPLPLAPGESLGIVEVLEKTKKTLHADGKPMEVWRNRALEPPVRDGYIAADPVGHRAEAAEFLKAQSTAQLGALRVASTAWAEKLKAAGKGHELLTWVKRKVTKKREMGARDMRMIAETYDLDFNAEHVSLEDLKEAVENSG